MWLVFQHCLWGAGHASAACCLQPAVGCIQTPARFSMQSVPHSALCVPLCKRLVPSPAWLVVAWLVHCVPHDSVCVMVRCVCQHSQRVCGPTTLPAVYTADMCVVDTVCMTGWLLERLACCLVVVVGCGGSPAEHVQLVPAVVGIVAALADIHGIPLQRDDCRAGVFRWLGLFCCVLGYVRACSWPRVGLGRPAALGFVCVFQNLSRNACFVECYILARPSGDTPSSWLCIPPASSTGVAAWSF